ncbi:hypothetical protein [Nocardia bovistercoris]|uniref:Uncharacterized protein n=1 Tax=Nocardia bovistercoris TaxID=2785916 RepID=A0A931N6B1_9NOCA|nr:hypothetical protein [Nocardia bovistercoris]MBH0780306.1 hypothetical protein [Nocardia bovistercoris]
MSGLLLFVATVGPMVLITGGFGLAVTRAQRRGLGPTVIGPFQDMWDPSAARTQVEIEIRAEQKAPTPSPGDPPSDEGPRVVPSK